MVWNTNEEAEIMGRKPGPIQEAGPGALSRTTEFYTTLPSYARIQLPLTPNRARMLRMVEELRGLANQIAFCMTRADLHPTWQQHLIHTHCQHLTRRWHEENRTDPHRPESQREVECTKSGSAE
jgi:hypothetical protein